MDWPACRWFAFIAHAVNALTVFMHFATAICLHIQTHIWLSRIVVKHQILLCIIQTRPKSPSSVAILSCTIMNMLHACKDNCASEF